MNDSSDTDADKVVYLRPPLHAGTQPWREAVRPMTGRAGAVIRGARQASRSGLVVVCVATWQVARVGICALLALIEPLLRITLVPLAFLGFLVTLIFGFLIGSPGYPRWGMLAMSVGLILVYWLFLGLMSLFMRLPPDHDRYR